MGLCEEYARLVVLGLFAVTPCDEVGDDGCVRHVRQWAGDSQGKVRCAAGFAKDETQAAGDTVGGVLFSARVCPQARAGDGTAGCRRI